MNPPQGASEPSEGARRRVIVVLSATAALVAIDLAVRALKPTLSEYNVGEYERGTRELSRTPMPDIILMGSSRAKYALVPEVFESVTGCRAYNCGIAGTKVVEWIALTRKLFATCSPRLVVLGINASEVRSDYAPSEAARSFFEWDDLIDSWAFEGVQLDVIGGYLRGTVGPAWALFDQAYLLKMWGQERLAWALPKHAQQSRELRVRVARRAPPNGFDHPWARGRQLRNIEERLLENVAEVEAARVPAFSPDAPTFRRLGQLLQTLRAYQIQPVVAYVPNSPRTENRWHDVEPQMIERIASVCGDAGATFVTCGPDEIKRGNCDYMEEIHVGLPLARRISRRVAERIVQVGLLPAGPRLAGHPVFDGE